MRTVTARTAIALAFLVTPACGDDTAGTASDSGGATSAGSQDASSSSAGSNSGSSSTTTDPASGSGTLGETTSTSDASATTNETSETGVDSGPKFDVGEMGDIGVDECQAKCGNTDWSYVWIANSAENTISKIDTRDVIEVGRYYTRPDTQGNPSRTSVSIDAKAVAVANRSGGIT